MSTKGTCVRIVLHLTYHNYVINEEILHRSGSRRLYGIIAVQVKSNVNLARVYISSPYYITILYNHRLLAPLHRLANSGFGHSGTPSPPFPSHPSLPPPLPPSLPREAPPPIPARGSGESCKLPSGVWGEAPADKRFGAYLSQKEQLRWQQFLYIFIRINFCTNTRLLSSRYSVGLRAKHSVGSRVKAPGQRVSRGTKSP